MGFVGPERPDDPEDEDRTPPGDARAVTDLPRWVALLALWQDISEERFPELVALGDGGLPPAWDLCSRWLLTAGVARPVPASEPPALAVVESWRGPLDDALSSLVSPASMRKWLALSDDPGARYRLLTGIEGWARRCSRWDVLNDLWLVMSENAAGITDAALATFADVPAEARKDYPSLTWACAMADASTAPPSRSRAEAFLGRLVLDSSLLHADWAQREDTDEAVTAGAVRMMGERWLPQSGAPLDSAWRTKRDVDAFVDERSRQGRPPGQFAHSFFRAFSGLLALLRADLRGAVEEARLSSILAEGPPITFVAHAVELLSQSFAGEVAAPSVGARPAGRPADYRFGGLSQMAAVMAAIAEGRRALQTLDRRGVEAGLRDVDPDMAAVVGLWAPWVALRGFHAALWGDPAEGLERLLAALAHQPFAGRGQDEPAGGVLLSRAREFLLSRVGASAAAVAAADALPARFGVVASARSRLWAGQTGLAVRMAEAALPSAELLPADRLQLLLVRGAATALDGRVPRDVAVATERALRELLSAHDYLPVAILPAPARDALMKTCAPLEQDPQLAAAVGELHRRLAELSGGDAGRGSPRLTERETVLLPLLATDLTVPAIAARLNVSANTVRKQVSNLREKFGASSRAELIRKATSRGALS